MKAHNKVLSVVVLLVVSSVYSFGKIADYRFEECSEKPDIIQNHVQNGLNGILTGNATVTPAESTLSFDGNGSMQVAHDAKLDIVGDLTLSLWVNPSVNAEQVLVSKGEEGEYFVGLREDGTVSYHHNNIADTYSKSIVPLNQWSHIVIRRKEESKEVRIYINGLFDSKNSYTLSAVSSSKDLTIGECIGCSDTIKAFQGKVDEVKIYNFVLSNEEIQSLYDTEKNGVHAQNHCYVSPLPTTVDDTLEVFEEGDVTVNILENDIDTNSSDQCTIDGTTLALVALEGATLSDDNKTLTVPDQGVWSVAGDTLTFTPQESFLTSPSVISYTVADSCGVRSDSATVTVTRTIVTDEEVEEHGGGNTTGTVTVTTVGTPTLVYGDDTFSIGDYVWYDTNQNGLQESDEEGVEGVVVALYNEEGNIVERATTNASGQYQFDTIAKGIYSLGFSNLPDGYTFTLQYEGEDYTMDSDANSVGRTDLFLLESNKKDLDAGIVLTPSEETNATIGTPITIEYDQADTSFPTHNEGEENCTCEPYNKDSIPSMGQIGVAVMLWLTTLIGLFFLREEKLLTIKK